MRRLLWIGIGLAVVQQATGINTVNYYAPSILERSGLGVSASLVATVAVGVTSVLMTDPGHLAARLHRTAPHAGYRILRRRRFPGDPRRRLHAAAVGPRQLHHPGRHDALRRVRAVLHRHLRLAPAVRDLPDGHPRFRHGHRRLRPLDRQRRDLLPVPDPRCRPGLHGNLRGLRAGEHRCRWFSCRSSFRRPRGSRWKNWRCTSAPAACPSSCPPAASGEKAAARARCTRFRARDTLACRKRPIVGE